MPYVIPFAPLNQEGVKEMVTQLLHSLRSHHRLKSYNLKMKKDIIIAPISLQRMYALIMHFISVARYKYSNYRGVEAIFEDLITQQVFKALATKQNLSIEVQVIVDDITSCSSTGLPSVQILIKEEKIDL